MWISPGSPTCCAQRRLREPGYRGPVDGVFSPRVEDAVRSVQLSQALPVTGAVDADTWERIGG